ncbi:isochorismatase family protein YecD [Rhodobiaceae bacterium]|nr:isochorismatase family protein YecD [Rhodobiaceae bacterium]
MKQFMHRITRGANHALVLAVSILALVTYVSGPASADEKSRAATAHLPPVNDGLPDPGFEIEQGKTALVITDPQNDFLSEDGVAWAVVGESVHANGVVENLEALMKTADDEGMPMFISPHYYFPTDHKWQHEGALEVVMHTIRMFDRPGQLTVEGFEGSGSDWLEQYKPYINNGKTVVTSPHKIYGPETNDLVLQLRKAGISKIILAGMSANLCTESHMRELAEQGFEIMVVTDATAGAITPFYNGYNAALTNFRMIASDIDNTENTVAAIKAAY